MSVLSKVKILEVLNVDFDKTELTERQLLSLIVDEIRANQIRISELEHTLLQMNNGNSPSS